VALNKKCAHCNAGEKKLSFCASCKSVEYCSRECQQAAWLEHKAVCKKLRASRRSEALLTANGAVIFESLDVNTKPHVAPSGPVRAANGHKVGTMVMQMVDVQSGYKSGLWNSVVTSGSFPSEAVDVDSIKTAGEWRELYRRHFGDRETTLPLQNMNSKVPCQNEDEPAEHAPPSEWKKAYEKKLVQVSGKLLTSINAGCNPVKHRHVWVMKTYLDGNLYYGSERQNFKLETGDDEWKRWSYPLRAASSEEKGMIALASPRITLDQARFDREMKNPATFSYATETTFAAPRGQDYFTLEQLAAVLHAYYFRPALGEAFCRHLTKTIGAAGNGVDQIAACPKKKGVYGCDWL
jgi:hypothetical protein